MLRTDVKIMKKENPLHSFEGKRMQREKTILLLLCSNHEGKNCNFEYTECKV